MKKHAFYSPLKKFDKYEMFTQNKLNLEFEALNSVEMWRTELEENKYLINLITFDFSLLFFILISLSFFIQLNPFLSKLITWKLESNFKLTTQFSTSK